MGILEIIDSLDKELLLYLNSLHSLFGDVFMWVLSAKLTWLPLIVLLLALIVKNKGRESILIILGIALAILLADQVASSFFKPLVERLRPSRSPSIMHELHIVNNYRGGLYGFVSSHSANVFAVAVFTSLLFKYRSYTLVILIWAASVSYSRIYLGVHYPMDIICGAICGIASGYIAYAVYRWSSKMLPFLRSEVPSTSQGSFSSTLFVKRDITILISAFIWFYVCLVVYTSVVLSFVS